MRWCLFARVAGFVLPGFTRCDHCAYPDGTVACAPRLATPPRPARALPPRHPQHHTFVALFLPVPISFSYLDCCSGWFAPTAFCSTLRPFPIVVTCRTPPAMPCTLLPTRGRLPSPTRFLVPTAPSRMTRPTRWLTGTPHSDADVLRPQLPVERWTPFGCLQ